MKSRITHTFEMSVSCAMYHDEYGMFGGSAICINDDELNEIVIEGFHRQHLVQMYRNAWCAADAPTSETVAAMPAHVRKCMYDIAQSMMSYESVKRMAGQ